MENHLIKDVPVTIINELLGNGLGYADWRTCLTDQGYDWNTTIKAAIMNQERELFKDEILELLDKPNQEPNTPEAKKTNSVAYVLERLQGKTGELEHRRQARRLMGKDTKYVRLVLIPVLSY